MAGSLAKVINVRSVTLIPLSCNVLRNCSVWLYESSAALCRFRTVFIILRACSGHIGYKFAEYGTVDVHQPMIRPSTSAVAAMVTPISITGIRPVPIHG